MKRNNLIILIIAALGLSAVAYLTSHKSTGTAPKQTDRMLLKDIDIDKIAAITMIDKSGAETTLKHTESGWVVPEKNNYPANYDRLQQAVVALTKVKIERELTLSDKQKKDMSITADSPKIQFKDESGKILQEITLGDMRENSSADQGPYGSMPTGRFISTDGGKSVVVVSETFYNFDNPSPKKWLNTEICSVPAADITTISVTGPQREAINLKNNKAGKKELSDLKDGEEQETAEISALENAVSYMNLDDIADSKLSDKELGMDSPVIFEAKTKDNLLYIVKIGAKAGSSDNRYARFSVTYIEPQASDKNDETAADDNQKSKIEAAQKKAKELNAKLAKWTYIIPSYKTDAMLKERAKLVKKTKTEKSEPVKKVAEPTDIKQVTPQPQAAENAAVSPQAKPTADEQSTDPSDK
jgi:hypothetical protein